MTSEYPSAFPSSPSRLFFLSLSAYRAHCCQSNLRTLFHPIMALFTQLFPTCLSHQIKSKPFSLGSKIVPSKCHCSLPPKVACLCWVGPLNVEPSSPYAYTFVHVFFTPFYFKDSLRRPQVFPLTHQSTCRQCYDVIWELFAVSQIRSFSLQLSHALFRADPIVLEATVTSEKNHF